MMHLLMPIETPGQEWRLTVAKRVPQLTALGLLPGVFHDLGPHGNFKTQPHPSRIRLPNSIFFFPSPFVFDSIFQVHETDTRGQRLTNPNVCVAYELIDDSHAYLSATYRMFVLTKEIIQPCDVIST